MGSKLLSERASLRPLHTKKELPAHQKDCKNVTVTQSALITFHGHEGQKFTFRVNVVDRTRNRYFDPGYLVFGRDFLERCVVGLDTYQLGDGNAKGRFILRSTEDHTSYWNTTYETRWGKW